MLQLCHFPLNVWICAINILRLTNNFMMIILSVQPEKKDKSMLFMKNVSMDVA